jgi:hypothetical protein
MARSVMPLLGRKERRIGNRFGEGREGRKDLQKVVILLSVVRSEVFCFSNFLLNITTTETFWVDLVVRNPLDAELNLANLTLVVRDVNGTQPEGESDPLVDVDVIEDVVLAPRESRIVSLIFRLFSQ